MMGYSDIRQLQQILFMRRFVAYLLVFKYLEKVVTINYSYDAVGNRTSEVHNSDVTNYSYTANKLISSTGAKAFNFSYDNNGNTTTENSKQYIYNQNQRLIKAVEGDKTLGEYL